MNVNQRNLIQGAGLSFLAGYVDTLGFVALFGLLTAQVTGNFVLIGAALIHGASQSLLLKLLAFPAFIAGIAIAHLVILSAKRHHKPALKVALLMEMLLLCGFMLVGMLASPIGRSMTPMAMVAGLLGAAAMGAHSAISKLLLTHLAPTSMMTGNITQVVIDTVDVLRGAADSGTRERWGKFFWPLIAFGAGASTAAFAYLALGFAALLLPLAILGSLAMFDREGAVSSETAR